MTTTLDRYRDAYASMVVAVYEPLILQWVSKSFADLLAYDIFTGMPSKKKMVVRRARGAEPPPDAAPPTAAPHADGAPARIRSGHVLLSSGDMLDSSVVESPDVQGLPYAEVIEGRFYPFGALRTESAGGSVVEHLGGRDPEPAPGLVLGPGLAGRAGIDQLVDKLPELRAELRKVFHKIPDGSASHSKKLVYDLSDKLLAGKLDLMLPDPKMVRELLSPIGIAHFYRQLYFNLDEGVGPLEEAFTIAPLETLEVVTETVRRQVHEEVIETGLEETSESELESHNLDEVSDKVSSMLQRDLGAGIQTNASYSTPVFQAGVSASLDLKSSTQRSTEETAKRLKETTKRSAERITKTFSIRTSSITETSSSSTTKRIIENTKDAPVSYGLRRVLRKVRVKVQDLGPRLVWQYYVQDPGAGLRLSRFVQYAAAQPISVPDVPPGLAPRPAPGTDSGSAVCSLRPVNEIVTSADSNFEAREAGDCTIMLRIPAGKGRKVTSVTIDSIADVGDPNPDRDSGEPAPFSYGAPALNADGTYQIEVTISPGDSWTVNVGYTYTFEPSDSALDEWEQARAQAHADLKAVANRDAFAKAFEQQRALITERSRIQPRPAADLRREEREEVMGRVVASVFASAQGLAHPSPLQIETVNRLFELDGVFTYVHPSWWRPRYSKTSTITRQEEYEITSDSDPARMGASLSWLMQLDGDTRRNAFLNSPWCRVCIPVRPGRERQALEWLANNVEDDTGFSIANNSPLGGILKELETQRANEVSLGIEGPDYIEVDATGTPGHGPLKPEDVYPVITIFDVTVPTEGFVYDEILIKTS